MINDNFFTLTHGHMSQVNLLAVPGVTLNHDGQKKNLKALFPDYKADLHFPAGTA